MSTTTGLDVNAFDVHDSNCITGNNTSLIQVKPMLSFGFLLAFEVFSDGVALQDDPIRLIFNFHLDFFADR
jgi:hypothetical protein